MGRSGRAKRALGVPSPATGHGEEVAKIARQTAGLSARCTARFNKWPLMELCVELRGGAGTVGGAVVSRQFEILGRFLKRI